MTEINKKNKRLQTPTAQRERLVAGRISGWLARFGDIPVTDCKRRLGKCMIIFVVLLVGAYGIRYDRITAAASAHTVRYYIENGTP